MTLHLPVSATRQRAVLDRLVCPRCHAALDRTDAATVDDVLVAATLRCGRCGDVGVVRSGRPSFLEREREVPADDVVGEMVGWDDADHLRGTWRDRPDGLLATAIGAACAGQVDGTGIVVELASHDWAGRIRCTCGTAATEVDLSAVEPGTHVLTLRGLPLGPHDWRVETVGAGSVGPHATQLMIRRVHAISVPSEVEPVEPLPVNRGNPYPPMFEELLGSVEEGAFVLDLGGGDRRHPDSRVFNLEYLPYLAVDLYGDGLALPFANGSVDFVLSQAVLEHVPEPPRAVAEISRILAPGASVYAEFAFMQPLHAVPFHFFNITPHGAHLLLEGFDDPRFGVFGGLGETTRWFFDLVRASERLGEARAQAVLEAMRELDAAMTERELEHLASAVWVLARNPAGVERR